MQIQQLMTNYANYNCWANESLIHWLSQKPVADFYQAMPSSYPSLVLTFNHILAVQEFWLSVVEKRDLENPRYLDTEPNHEEVFATLLTQSKTFAVYVTGLAESDMDELIHLDTPWIKGELQRVEFLQHLFNHSTYHRGQAVTIGRQLGYTDAPMTDYNFYNMAILRRGVSGV